MNAKERATEIYTQHLALAAANGKGFRKTVMDQLMTETGCSLAAAATHYNNAKKLGPVVIGLGRAAVPKTLRKMSKGKPEELEVEELDCFTVIEVVEEGTNKTVGRTHAYEGLGLARIKYRECISRHPGSTWVLMQGLGPIHGDGYKLETGEAELESNRVIIHSEVTV